MPLHTAWLFAVANGASDGKFAMYILTSPVQVFETNPVMVLGEARAEVVSIACCYRHGLSNRPVGGSGRSGCVITLADHFHCQQQASARLSANHIAVSRKNWL